MCAGCVPLPASISAASTSLLSYPPPHCCHPDAQGGYAGGRHENCWGRPHWVTSPTVELKRPPSCPSFTSSRGLRVDRDYMQQLQMVQPNGGMRHFLYRLQRISSTGRTETTNSLGKLEIRWHGAMGEVCLPPLYGIEGRGRKEGMIRNERAGGVMGQSGAECGLLSIRLRCKLLLRRSAACKPSRSWACRHPARSLRSRSNRSRTRFGSINHLRCTLRFARHWVHPSAVLLGSPPLITTAALVLPRHGSLCRAMWSAGSGLFGLSAQ